MKLLDDWAVVLKKAWSIRFALLSALCSAAEVGLPYFTDFVPPGTMAILAALVACGSAISRIVAQTSIPPKQ